MPPVHIDVGLRELWPCRAIGAGFTQRGAKYRQEHRQESGHAGEPEGHLPCFIHYVVGHLVLARSSVTMSLHRLIVLLRLLSVAGISLNRLMPAALRDVNCDVPFVRCEIVYFIDRPMLA